MNLFLLRKALAVVSDRLGIADVISVTVLRERVSIVLGEDADNCLLGQVRIQWIGLASDLRLDHLLRVRVKLRIGTLITVRISAPTSLESH